MAIKWNHFVAAAAVAWWLLHRAGAPLIPLMIGTAAVAGWNFYNSRRSTAPR